MSAWIQLVKFYEISLFPQYILLKTLLARKNCLTNCIVERSSYMWVGRFLFFATSKVDLSRQLDLSYPCWYDRTNVKCAVWTLTTNKNYISIIIIFSCMFLLQLFLIIPMPRCVIMRSDLSPKSEVLTPLIIPEKSTIDLVALPSYCKDCPNYVELTANFYQIV